MVTNNELDKLEALAHDLRNLRVLHPNDLRMAGQLASGALQLIELARRSTSGSDGDALYRAWHKVGADVAGLNFADFIAVLEASGSDGTAAAGAGGQRVWIVNDDRGEHVMMCPQEPTLDAMMRLAGKIGRAVFVLPFVLYPAATAPATSGSDDWVSSTSSGCMYPNCQTEAEQDRIAAEVHRQLYGGSDETQSVKVDERALAPGSDLRLEAALDREYPLPNSPHASVNDRACNNRAAFERGWYAALAQQATTASAADDNKYDMQHARLARMIEVTTASASECRKLGGNCACQFGQCSNGLDEPAPSRDAASDAPAAEEVPEYEAKFQRDITELVMRHIDRMNDVCEQDTAENIIASFTQGFYPIFDPYMDAKFPGRAAAISASQGKETK